MDTEAKIMEIFEKAAKKVNIDHSSESRSKGFDLGIKRFSRSIC